MNLQNIIVIVIVFACVVYVGRHIVNYFKETDSGKNPCTRCTSGCDLKRMMEEKKRDCAKKEKNKKKKCCR